VTARGASVRAENVRKVRRGSDGGEQEILRGLSFSAEAARLSVIVGPSGGGKSTLIRLVNRLEDPTSGRLLLDGEDLATIDPLRLRRRVGTVLQKPFMYEGTVQDNLRRPFLLRGENPPATDSDLFAGTLALCRLEQELLGREARSLSLGQQQRVSLARTLVTRPEVLLLDEPTSALDRPTGDRLAETFRNICRSEGITILMVTHDLRLAERVADRMAYLEGGRVIEEGDPRELLNRPQSDQLQRFLAEPGEGAE
jgi:putative ABC transport system ATP-binding protein